MLKIIAPAKAQDIYQNEVRPHSMELYQLVSAMEGMLKSFESRPANSPPAHDADDPSVLLMRAKTIIENKG